MSLRGQESGYAMAAMLVALAVMAVMMSVAMPVWRHEARRHKEEELIWRGTQYVRAIRLYNAKFRTFPPSYDVLVSGNFLRKKYKDPITNDDFEPIGAGTGQPGLAPGQGQATPGRGQPVIPATSNTPTPSANQPSTAFSSSSGSVPGGLIGVRSKSKDESIKIYQGRTHYNEWTFVYVNQQPGGPQRGGPPGQRGRGGPPGPPPPPPPPPIRKR